MTESGRIGGVSSGAAQDPQEARWIRAASQGDAAAFEHLYRRYLSDVRDFCARRIGDPIRAEDLAQDTFLRAFEQMASFRPGAAFWPWLSTIARHLCIDELRLRRRTGSDSRYRRLIGQTVQSDQLDPTSDEALAEETRSQIGVAVRAAMDRLPERDRRLIWHHAVERLSWREIASRNRTSLHAARNAAWRARGRMRSMLVESLRDLRAWIAVTLGSSIAASRAWANRVKGRTDSSWVSVGETFCRCMADVALAAALVSAGYFAGATAVGSHATSTMRSRAASPASSSFSIDTSHQASGPIHDGLERSATRNQTLRNGPVTATMTTRTRPRSVAPAAADNRIEIRDANGNVIYWDETTMSCGDGRTSDLLSKTGMIRAYC